MPRVRIQRMKSTIASYTQPSPIRPIRSLNSRRERQRNSFLKLEEINHRTSAVSLSQIPSEMSQNTKPTTRTVHSLQREPQAPLPYPLPLPPPPPPPAAAAAVAAGDTGSGANTPLSIVYAVLNARGNRLTGQTTAPSTSNAISHFVFSDSFL